MKAIQYLRWSTLEQGNSDKSSEYRQDGKTRAFCEQQGWEIVERHVDSGRSAYTGANLTKGKLGELTKRFLSGELDPTQHVVVVEALDRLSRQKPRVMLKWFSSLLDVGLASRSRSASIVRCSKEVISMRIASRTSSFSIRLISFTPWLNAATDFTGVYKIVSELLRDRTVQQSWPVKYLMNIDVRLVANGETDFTRHLVCCRKDTDQALYSLRACSNIRIMTAGSSR